MKKQLLFIAFALSSTLFSCSPDEFETQPKKETAKTINSLKDTYADGPGDGIPPGKPPIKPPTDL